MAKPRRRMVVKRGLRLVALLEAAKGVLVLLAGCGLLSLIHKDLHEAAEQLVRHLHLNPARHYPSVFISLAYRITDLQLWALALSALTYAGIRLAEAYGLWTQRRWAEWVGLLSGAIYLPVELFEVLRQATWPRVTVLVANLGVVAYLGYALLRRRNHRP